MEKINIDIQFCEFCNAKLTDIDKMNPEHHCSVCRENSVPYTHLEYKVLIYKNASDSVKQWAVVDFVEGGIALEHSRAKCYIGGDYVTTLYTHNSNFIENK